MEFERFFKFSQLLLRDEFVLSYSGYVSEDILEAVGDTLRRWWQRDKMQKKRYLITVSISDRCILGQLGICTESTVAPVAHWPAKTPFCWHRTVPLGKR